MQRWSVKTRAGQTREPRFKAGGRKWMVKSIAGTKVGIKGVYCKWALRKFGYANAENLSPLV